MRFNQRPEEREARHKAPVSVAGKEPPVRAGLTCRNSQEVRVAAADSLVEDETRDMTKCQTM